MKAQLGLIGSVSSPGMRYCREMRAPHLSGPGSPGGHRNLLMFLDLFMSVSPERYTIGESLSACSHLWVQDRLVSAKLSVALLSFLNPSGSQIPLLDNGGRHLMDSAHTSVRTK